MAENELDPTGRNQHEPGAKLDAGKPRPALVLGNFSRALSAVTDVGSYGARKYTDNGWRTVPEGVERYTEAMIRHWLEECGDKKYDAETNLLHAAHLAWNALARLELMLLSDRQDTDEQPSNYLETPDTSTPAPEPPTELPSLLTAALKLREENDLSHLFMPKLSPPPEPSEPPTDAERLADFAQWLAREMPRNTVIGDPLWWAPRIARAVLERWGHR